VISEELPITNVANKSDGKLLPLLYSSRPDDNTMNIQAKLNEEKIVTKENVTNDNTTIFGGTWWPTTTKNVDKDDSTSWWPIITKDAEEEDDFESWWPTNPIVIDSLEAKSPSETGVIDWSFLDNEYPDPPNNTETQSGEISTNNELPEKLPLTSITSLPGYSISNINDTQINMLKFARKSDIEVQKVPNQRGSLSMMEMIKEMTMYLYYVLSFFKYLNIYFIDIQIYIIKITIIIFINCGNGYLKKSVQRLKIQKMNLAF
jgi:hypothetical protein